MSASLSAGESRDNGLQAIWSRLRANPKLPLLVAASAAIAIIVALLLWAKSPDYRVLYSNLNDRDGGAIVTQLTQMNIPYRFAENGAALMIPADNEALMVGGILRWRSGGDARWRADERYG